MAFIGNTPTQQAFTPAIDYFSGNGSTVAFTLSRNVASVAQVQCAIENVPQNPTSAFTVSGNTITFTSAPPAGTNNIYVYYTSPITQVIAPSQGTVGSVQLQTGAVGVSNLSATGTPSSSTYLRGDNTWATVAGGVTSLNGVTGAVSTVALYDIGSFIVGRPANATTYAVNNTIAGSSLYATSSVMGWQSGVGFVQGTSNAADAVCYTLVNTGSWRCVSPAAYNSSSAYAQSGLWVRYA